MVLANVQAALKGGATHLSQELRQVAARHGNDVTLGMFLEETGRTLDEVYAAGGFTALCRRAGL